MPEVEGDGSCRGDERGFHCGKKYREIVRGLRREKRYVDEGE